MTTYFVDDAGNNTTGDSWANAFSSVYAMLTHGTNPRGTAGAPLASGDILYLGSDSVDAASYSANATLVGPTSGIPAVLISSTVGAGTTVSYAKSASRQIDTSNNGANTYTFTFDGAFAGYGVFFKSGGDITNNADLDEPFALEECTLALGAGAKFSSGGPNAANFTRAVLKDCTFNLTADGTTNRSNAVIMTYYNTSVVLGATFVNAAYRTGSVFAASTLVGETHIEGCDFSGFTNGTACELWSGNNQKVTITNCLTAATWAALSGTIGSGSYFQVTATGPADDPTMLNKVDYFGAVLSSIEIYRSSGAEVESVAVGWLITTTEFTSEGAPFCTPWIYGTTTAGSKTFDLYITNDTADFTDAEVWLEVEYLSTAGEAIWALATDQRATITATPAAQTDDGDSVWVGLNDDSQGLADFMQKLSVAATVGEAGQYRARVAVGVASIASSRYFYCDPKIEIL